VGTLARFAALASGALVFAVSAISAAEPMDPALDRLVLDPACRSDTGAFVDDDATLDRLQLSTGRRACAPDHLAFKKLMNQYGFAFAPSAMHSARTTGFGGFHLSLEAAFTKIDDGALYWQRGTQGPTDPSNNRASITNKSPQEFLTLYSAKIRKSFGFGLELTGTVGFMPKTSIVSGGADVRLSLLEGFRSGVPGILPDIAVGGGVRTITGTPQFQLTVAGLDVQVSKPLPIADSSVLTPWIGFQYVWIFADSGLVDLTPGTDPVAYCNYAGQNVPGNHDPNKPDGQFDGQPVCRGGSPIDFNNNVVFDKARLERQRLLLGTNYRYEMVMVGIQFITDIVDPADAQAGDDTTTIIRNGQPAQISDKEALADESRQWTLVLELGAMF
jgi:hypothetical protein